MCLFGPHMNSFVYKYVYDSDNQEKKGYQFENWGTWKGLDEECLGETGGRKGKKEVL